jgi:predicted ATPase
MHLITQVLTKIYHNEKLRQTVIPLFIGKTGIGKTMLVEQFAKSVGANMIEMIASQLSPFEISGICIPNQESKLMQYYDFDRLINLKDGDILFIDELLQGNPAVLSAFLTLLEQRKTISGKPLAKIMIVAAADEEGMPVLTPAIKQRFIWYDIKFDKNSWLNDYMFPTYNITSSIGNKLANLITNETFTGRNFFTPRSICKAIDMILDDCPTPYSTEILPILEEFIVNDSENTIMIENTEFLPNERKKWIDIKKLLIQNKK